MIPAQRQPHGPVCSCEVYDVEAVEAVEAKAQDPRARVWAMFAAVPRQGGSR